MGSPVRSLIRRSGRVVVLLGVVALSLLVGLATARMTARLVHSTAADNLLSMVSSGPSGPLPDLVALSPGDRARLAHQAWLKPLGIDRLQDPLQPSQDPARTTVPVLLTLVLPSFDLSRDTWRTALNVPSAEDQPPAVIAMQTTDPVARLFDLWLAISEHGPLSTIETEAHIRRDGYADYPRWTDRALTLFPRSALHTLSSDPIYGTVLGLDRQIRTLGQTADTVYFWDGVSIKRSQPGHFDEGFTPSDAADYLAATFPTLVSRYGDDKLKLGARFYDLTTPAAAAWITQLGTYAELVLDRLVQDALPTVQSDLDAFGSPVICNVVLDALAPFVLWHMHQGGSGAAALTDSRAVLTELHRRFREALPTAQFVAVGLPNTIHAMDIAILRQVHELLKPYLPTTMSFPAFASALPALALHNLDLDKLDDLNRALNPYDLEVLTDLQVSEPASVGTDRTPSGEELLTLHIVLWGGIALIIAVIAGYGAIGMLYYEDVVARLSAMDQG